MVKLITSKRLDQSTESKHYQHYRVPAPGECLSRLGEMDLDVESRRSGRGGVLPSAPSPTGGSRGSTVTDRGPWWRGITCLNPTPGNPSMEGKPTTITDVRWPDRPPEGNTHPSPGIPDAAGESVLSGGTRCQEESSPSA